MRSEFKFLAQPKKKEPFTLSGPGDLSQIDLLVYRSEMGQNQ
jgi:hypothetical protein